MTEITSVRGGKRRRFPNDPSKTKSLIVAQEARSEITRVLKKKMLLIQQFNGNDGALLALNTEINSLIHKKRAWEERVFELGGPDQRDPTPLSDEPLFFGTAKKFKRQFRSKKARGIQQVSEDLQDIDLDDEYYGNIPENQVTEVETGERELEDIRLFEYFGELPKRF